MPLIYERPFRIRHYECDTYGRLHHANLARFMQETAVDASTNVGYDITRYETMKRLWLIRETELSVFRPLVADDTIIVKTWVHDFRRVRSRRAYEMRLANSGEIAAQASTDWIFLDTEQERPTAVSDDMILAFMPEGIPEQAPRRQKFPKTPPAPPGVYKLNYHVQWADIDGAGHMNNAVYLTVIENCTSQHLLDIGWPPARFIEQKCQVTATKYQIEYLQPAFLGEALEISTFISDVQEETAVRHFIISRPADKAVLARVQVQWSLTDSKNEVPIPFPAQFISAFSVNKAITTEI